MFHSDNSILTDYEGFNADVDPSMLGWSQLQVVARLLGIDKQIDLGISNRQTIEDAVVTAARYPYNARGRPRL